MTRLLPPERDFGILRSPIRPVAALFGALALLIAALALIERVGMESGFVSVAVIGAALVFFVLAALVSHGRRAVDFYVGDRRISGAFGGVAGGASLAGILAVGLVGGAYASRLDFLAAAAGFALGLLLLAGIVAPALRRLGVYTVGDFLAIRFGSIWVRLAGAAVTFIASFFLLLAQLTIASALLATLTGLAPLQAILGAAALTALPVLAGGMRSLTWTQAAQYFVAVFACLVPAAYLSFQAEARGALGQDFAMLLLGNLPAKGSEALVEFALPLFFMGLAAASLPYFGARALAAPSPREAAASMIWSMLFAITIAAAGLVLWQVLTGVDGAMVETFAGGDLLRLAALFGALPAVLAGLVAAGTLAALFALGQAALFSATTALSRDVVEIVEPDGPETLRIVLARIVVVALAAIAAALLSLWRMDAPTLLQWGLAFGAAGGLAPLILGLKWGRCNDVGALAGILSGFGFTLVAFGAERGLIGSAAGSLAAIGAPAAALAGTAAAFAVTFGVSLIVPAPDAAPDKANREAGGSPASPPAQELPA